MKTCPYGSRSFISLKKGGKEQVCLIIVVPRSDHVDDCSSEFVKASGANPCRFDSVEGSRIDIGQDSVGFDFNGGRAMPEPFELLYGFLKPLLEGGAPQ